MGEYTPLDISTSGKKQNSEGGINSVLIILSIVTVGVIGFIVYLFVTQY